jgi:NAD+ synthetase
VRIALAQINTTVGDLEGNGRLVVEAVRRGAAEGCGLVVFPELTLSGYPPRDLLEKTSFASDAQSVLRDLAGEVRGATALVGCPLPNASPVGRALFNSAVLLADGEIKAAYHKALLPTYDVFDEGRYFETGAEPLVFQAEGVRFGVSICEDIWYGTGGRSLYPVDPVTRYRAREIDWLINISASPFSLGKDSLRREIARLAGRSTHGLIYLNLVGGNDELIFDGASFALDREGQLMARAASFREDFVVLDTAAKSRLEPEQEEDEAASAAEALVLGLRDYAAKCGFPGVVLGLSGGIDSAVTAALAVRALGPSNVTGILMTSRFTSDESVQDARDLAANLGIRTHDIPIHLLHRDFLEALAGVFAGLAPDVTEENIQARIRGTLLMAVSNKFNLLLLNTGNKSELAMGYCTLYGDMNGGLSVIGDLPKTLVYRVGRHLSGARGLIPERIFTKAPTAELRPNQRDQDTLPPYEDLDPLLRLYIEENRTVMEMAALGHPPELVRQVVDRVDRNEYKRRQAPPVLRVTSKAFGMGRRLPIAQRYRPR